MWFYTILFILNVVTFGLYALDKNHAVYAQSRVPEAVLLGLTVIGGSYGACMGMLLFRHKTRHRAFQITAPLFFVIWVAISVCLIIFAHPHLTQNPYFNQ